MLLGVDYGKVHVGLALSESGLPAPLQSFSTKSDERKLDLIEKSVQDNNIEGIVIGKGSGQLVPHIRGFISKLKKRVTVPVFNIDETLTSNVAVEHMIKHNVSRKKRKTLEHAYAACILLSLYYEQSKQY